MPSLYCKSLWIKASDKWCKFLLYYNRGMGKEVERLKEVEERVKGLERDNRELAKQGAINQRALVTLREELVSDKLKTQQRENELEWLAHELEMRVLNQDTSPQSDEETPDNR
uniref:Uncharacterized protein n=1 Tax=Hucho hucho TaxID=62062 RepID=A0A4W5NWK1_9TELE